MSKSIRRFDRRAVHEGNAFDGFSIFRASHPAEEVDQRTGQEKSVAIRLLSQLRHKSNLQSVAVQLFPGTPSPIGQSLQCLDDKWQHPKRFWSKPHSLSASATESIRARDNEFVLIRREGTKQMFKNV
jgi:hypothetical protein